MILTGKTDPGVNPGLCVFSTLINKNYCKPTHSIPWKQIISFKIKPKHIYKHMNGTVYVSCIDNQVNTGKYTAI
jgi:hypothetical protein